MVLPWQPRDRQEQNGSYHPTSGASSFPSHCSFHVTNYIIKKSQIVINYQVYFPQPPNMGMPEPF